MQTKYCSEKNLSVTWLMPIHSKMLANIKNLGLISHWRQLVSPFGDLKMRFRITEYAFKGVESKSIKTIKST